MVPEKQFDLLTQNICGFHVPTSEMHSLPLSLPKPGRMKGRGRDQARKRDPEREMAVMMVAGERAERTAFAAGISGRSRQQLAGQNP